MRKMIFMLAFCLCGFAGEMHAQKFLKGLKDKAGAVVKDPGAALKDAENKLKTKEKKQAPVQSTTTKQQAEKNNSEPEEQPLVKGVHQGNMGDDFTYHTPEVSGAAKVIVRDDPRYLTSFQDGVTYVYTGKGGFYMDKHGKRLFDTEVEVTNEARMPRFSDGVVMEVVEVNRGKVARIRDRQGAVVKELPNVIAASNFDNGTALVIMRPEAQFGPAEVKYVNTKGEFVFPDLYFQTRIEYTLEGQLNLLMRKQAEGLTAFVKQATPDAIPVWGFRDASGSVVIEPSYIAVCDFSEGLAAVMTEVDGEARWGFINKSGKMVIAPKFTERPSNFNSGYSLVLDRKGNGYYMNKSGDFALGPVNPHAQEKDEYFYISPFQNGYAIAGVLIKDPNADWDYIRRVFFVIDSSFRRISWSESVPMHPDMEEIQFVYYGGNYYLGSQSEGWNLFDPKTFDRLARPHGDLFGDGLVPVSSSISYKYTGFLNEKGDYSIIFEEEQF